MTLERWIDARVELVDGYYLLDSGGARVSVVDDAPIRFEGGFVHIQFADLVQVVSAPAVRRLSYLAAACPI
ncbi:MAG: hypothetical protein ACRCYU_04675 [Nocardioides sp.]